MSTIFNTFFNQILVILGNILPDSEGLPIEVHDGLATVFDYAYTFDFIFPTSTVLSVITFIIGFELILFGVNLIRFVLNLFRGSSA